LAGQAPLAAPQRAPEQEAAARAVLRQNEHRHILAQVEEAGRETRSLEARVTELSTFLAAGLSHRPQLDLEDRRVMPHEPPLQLGADATPSAPPQWDNFMPRSRNWLTRLFGGTSSASRLNAGLAEFTKALARYRFAETQRRQRVATALRIHAAVLEAAREAARATNSELQAWIDGIAGRSKAAVERYLAEVLDGVPLPTGFPRNREVTFRAAQERTVVRFELPPPEIVPKLRSVTYLRSRDECVTRERPARECAALYRRIISQVALLAVRNLFVSDACLATVTFNGVVTSDQPDPDPDPDAGHQEVRCLVSAVVSREEFDHLVLGQVAPEDCLTHLRAVVSARPQVLEPVQPLEDVD
jgi:restriction system protein